MAFQDYYSTIEKAFLAYFGRPADLGGLAYWGAQLETNKGNTSTMVSGFAGSKEAQDKYGGLSNGDMVDAIYQNVFQRSADAAGKAYWVDLLDRGEISGTQAAFNIIDSAAGNDKIAIDTQIKNALNLIENSGQTPQLESLAMEYFDGMPFPDSSISHTLSGIYKLAKMITIRADGTHEISGEGGLTVSGTLTVADKNISEQITKTTTTTSPDGSFHQSSTSSTLGFGEFTIIDGQIVKASDPSKVIFDDVDAVGGMLVLEQSLASHHQTLYWEYVGA